MGLQWIGGLDTNSTIEFAIERAKSQGTTIATKNDGRGVAYRGFHHGILGEFWVQSSYLQSHRVSSMMFKVYPESKDMAVLYFNADLEHYERLYGTPSAYDFDANTVDLVSSDSVSYYEMAAWSIDNEQLEIGVAFDRDRSKYRYSVFISNRC